MGLLTDDTKGLDFNFYVKDHDCFFIDSRKKSVENIETKFIKAYDVLERPYFFHTGSGTECVERPAVVDYKSK